MDSGVPGHASFTTPTLTRLTLTQGLSLLYKNATMAWLVLYFAAVCAVTVVFNTMVF